MNDTAANFATCKKLTQEAVRKGCQIVFFPECFSFIGAQAGEAQAVAEPLDGPTMGWYKQLARDESVWLSLGGYQEKGLEGDPRIYNTHVIINSAGSLIAAYRKIHLYDVPMVGLVESKQAIAGRELLSCDSPVGKLGLAICYDMRFPEMHQKLTFSHGAEVLTFPSAFAMKTGEAHWETLLRCRAIECQTYVVAAAQVGQHNEHGNKRQSWGHAMAVDPWGKVVAQFGGAGDVGVKPFEIDLDLVQKTRDNMPMHAHRRYDLYGDQAVDSERSLVGGSRTGSVNSRTGPVKIVSRTGSVKMVLDGTDSGSSDDNGGGKGGGGGGGKGGGGGGLASNSIEAQILTWVRSNEGQTALAEADEEGWDFVDEDEEDEDEEDEDEDEDEVPFEEQAVVAASRAAPGPSAPEPAAPKPAASKLETPTASSPKSPTPKPTASQVATSSAPKPTASRAAKSPAPKPAVSRVVSTKRTKSTKPAPGASKRRA